MRRMGEISEQQGWELSSRQCAVFHQMPPPEQGSCAESHGAPDAGRCERLLSPTPAPLTGLLCWTLRADRGAAGRVDIDRLY